MSFEMKLATLMNRDEELTALLSETTDGAEIVKYSKEKSQLEPIVNAGKKLRLAQEQMKEVEILMKETDDAEMKELAATEYYDLKEKMPDI